MLMTSPDCRVKSPETTFPRTLVPFRLFKSRSRHSPSEQNISQWFLLLASSCRTIRFVAERPIVVTWP
jgi:hypothetical protein